MKKTTLNEIWRYEPCLSGWGRLLRYLNKTEADDDKLSFITILESNGIKDAIWCLRTLPDYDLDVMTFKLKCARRVEHLDHTGVAKSTLDVVERFIDGKASEGDLNAAAYAAADAATYAATYAAAYAAADAAYVAADDAADAAADAADAEREYQTEIFKDIFNNEKD